MFFVFALVLSAGLAVLCVPRRYALAPLLVVACYVPFYGDSLEIGPFHFTAIRIVIALAVVRVIARGEWTAVRLNALDWMVILWGVWNVWSGSFHEHPTEAVVLRLGATYNAWGTYFPARAFLRSQEDIASLAKSWALVLLPVAAEMLYEKLAVENLFYSLAGTPIPLEIREGSVRALGAFAHSILGGTLGATSFPIVMGLWRTHRRMAVFGATACVIIVVTSASSGPILSFAAGVVGMLLMRYRRKMWMFRWGVLASYIGLDLLMNDPAYFVLSRIDLAGGSTGWHRAQLIRSSLEHFDEWWIIGTDRTRHWMPTGIPADENHTDITNYYLSMGVNGGLLLMLLFMACLAIAFTYVGRIMAAPGTSDQSRFMAWCCGAALGAHAVTFLSVAYFDQSFIPLNLVLAAIGSGWAVSREKVRVQSPSLHSPDIQRIDAGSRTSPPVRVL